MDKPNRPLLPDVEDVSSPIPFQIPRTANTSQRRRGRPAKDPSGDTSLDRRRARVREATRALRRRKEANLQALEKRNAALESAVDRMSTMFIDFSDALLQSKAVLQEPDMTRRLKDITADVLSLARATTEGTAEGVQKVDEIGFEPTGPVESLPSSGDSDSSTPLISLPDEQPSFVPYAQSSTMRSSDHRLPSKPLPTPKPKPSTSLTHRKGFWSLTKSPIASTLLTPQLELNSLLDSPFATPNFTYALLKTCLSLAWDALRGRSADSLSLAKSMFRFALLHRSIGDLLASIRHSLLVGVAQDIGLVRDGNEYPSTANNLVDAIAETLFLRGKTEEDFINYEDGEGYLRGRGAFWVDGRVVKMLRWPDNDSERLIDLGDLKSSGQSSPSFDNDVTLPTERGADTIGLPSNSGSNRLSTPPVDPLFVPLTGDRDETGWNDTEILVSGLQVVTLNVETLVRNLAIISVCLGRGPAFLPEHLDQAIEASGVETVF